MTTTHQSASLHFRERNSDKVCHAAIESGEVSHLIRSPKYCLQQKHDGRRLFVRKQGDTVTGINRPVIEAADHGRPPAKNPRRLAAARTMTLTQRRRISGP